MTLKNAKVGQTVKVKKLNLVKALSSAELWIWESQKEQKYT